MSRYVFTLLMFFCTSTILADGKRVALVIGNQNYHNFNHLKTPKGNAEKVAEVLGKLGFELIDGKAVTNADNNTMGKCIDSFMEESKGAEVAILYYSGHGAESKKALLFPIDATGMSAGKELNTIHEYLSKKDNKIKASIIIYDACRTEDEIIREQLSAEPVDVDRLTLKFKTSENAGQLEGHVIYYAVESGKVARDNGLFTKAWLDYFKSKSNITINNAFRNIYRALENIAEDYKPAAIGSIKGSLFGPINIVSDDEENATTNTDEIPEPADDKQKPAPLYIGLGISFPFSFQPTIGLNLGKQKHGFVDFSIGSNFKKTKEIYYYNTQGDIVTEQRYSNLDIRLRGGYMWNLPKSNKFQYGLYAGYDCLIITGKYGANVHSLLGGVQIEYSPTHWLSLFGNAEFAPAVSNNPANNYKDIETLCPEIKDWAKPFRATIGVKFNIPTSKR